MERFANMGDAPVGSRIRRELDRLGWTQADLANVLGKSRPDVVNIIAGKLGVTVDVAARLATALGGTPKEWLDLDVERQIATVPLVDAEVVRRARLYRSAPVKAMERRGWIAATKSVDGLETELAKFFEHEPRDVSLRRSNEEDLLKPEQRAWLCRVSHLAKVPPAVPFDHSKMMALGRDLRALAAYPDDVYRLPRVFSDYGIRFVVVEPLPGGLIDGAMFWLDPSSPIIAVSFRFDRIDWLWHTVIHEWAHLKNRDSFAVDANLVGSEAIPASAKSESERTADEEAASLLVPREKLDDFINRVGPLYSKTRIIQFANVVRMHPGIIVGQLQHRGEIGYSANREMLVKVRDRAISASICDGWGRTAGI